MHFIQTNGLDNVKVLLCKSLYSLVYNDTFLFYVQISQGFGYMYSN